MSTNKYCSYTIDDSLKQTLLNQSNKNIRIRCGENGSDMGISKGHMQPNHHGWGWDIRNDTIEFSDIKSTHNSSWNTACEHLQKCTDTNSPKIYEHKGTMTYEKLGELNYDANTCSYTIDDSLKQTLLNNSNKNLRIRCGKNGADMGITKGNMKSSHHGWGWDITGNTLQFSNAQSSHNSSWKTACGHIKQCDNTKKPHIYKHKGNPADFKHLGDLNMNSANTYMENTITSSPFHILNYNSSEANCEPNFTKITTNEECKEAGNIFGYGDHYSGNWGHVTGGCSLINKISHWNTRNIPNKKNGAVQNICKKKQSIVSELSPTSALTSTTTPITTPAATIPITTPAATIPITTIPTTTMPVKQTCAEWTCPSPYEYKLSAIYNTTYCSDTLCSEKDVNTCCSTPPPVPDEYIPPADSGWNMFF